MGAAVSSSHVVCAAPSSSGEGLLTLCPCSSVRSLSQETVLHKLLQRESFPWAASLHELPQRGSFHRVQSFRNRLLQRGSPTGSQALSVNLLWRGLGPQVLAGACSSAGLPTGSQHSSGIHLLWRGVPSMGCRLISAPPWTSMGCRGTACLTRVFITS